MTAPTSATGVLRSIALSVPDGGTAERLLRTVTELPVTVRDGERWIAMDAGSLTFALTESQEVPGDAQVAVNVKVDDVNRAYEALLAAGGLAAQEPTLTTHEVRAAVYLSETVALTVYAPRQPNE